MVLNKQNIVTLHPTNETSMKHIFNSIKHGGKYSITIVTDVENAIPTQPFIYVAPPIKPPRRLTVLWDYTKYVIYWQEPELPDKWHYEILVAEGIRTINESTAKVFQTRDPPPYHYKDVKTDTIYTFAMRVVTDEGYQSALSEAWSTQISG